MVKRKSEYSCLHYGAAFLWCCFRITHLTETYEGDMWDGIRHGKGQHIYSDGSVCAK